MQRDLASTLAGGSEAYRALDTTLIPDIVRVRACRKGLFAGQTAFGRSVSKTEWVYGFKVALLVNPEGVITALGLAPANCDERQVGEFLVVSDGHDAFLADKRFASEVRERRWLEEHGAPMAAPAEERPAGVAGSGPPVGGRQAADHRGGDLAAQGPLQPGAS